MKNEKKSYMKQSRIAKLLRIRGQQSQNSQPAASEESVGSSEERVSPYFEENWYRATYEEVQNAEISPWQHFLRIGDIQHFRPSIYFDSNYYTSRYANVIQAGIGPFIHYESCGVFDGHAPNPYFDSIWYSSQFDGQAPEGDLFLHYIQFGWKSGISPTPYFDVKWYISTNADVAAADVEPLRHYLEFGYQEGRCPNPYFDVEYYNRSNIDVKQEQIEPLKHYIMYGWRETGRQPNSYFDKEWYRERYMVPSEAEQDPFRHYIIESSRCNVSPSPNFDRDFYLTQSPELAEGVDAYRHFMTIGRAEGRRPNARTQAARRNDILSWAKANGAQGRVNTTSMIARPLLRLLGHIDVVSFDIFDTLIERTSGEPESVFNIVAMIAYDLGYTGSDYSEQRKKAESIARYRSGRQEINLNEIYDEFHKLGGASRAVCVALRAAELEAELSVCVPKLAGQVLFDAAARAGKDIILLTDIYLPAATVREILRRGGYDRPFRLFVSSELGATKHYGQLFSYAIAQMNARPDRIVHIGDNSYSDGEMARDAGLRTLLVSKSPVTDRRLFHPEATADAARATQWAAIVRAESTRTGRSRQTERAGHSNEGELKLIGTNVVGPLLLGFTQFLAKRVEVEEYNQLFFASRDAFYLKEAYDIFRTYFPELPKSQYFYASRKVCRFASLYSVEDIILLAGADHYPMTVRKILESRFMINETLLKNFEENATEILNTTIASGATDERLHTFLKQHAREILSGAETHREAYMTYLASIGFGGDADAVIDIGYRGTVQRSLSRITRSRPAGIYLMAWPEVERLLADGLRFDAYFQSKQDASDIINRNLQILELLLSGTHASISRFSMKAGKPVPHLTAIDTTATTRSTLNETRQSALQFVDTMCARYGRLLLATALEPKSALTPLRNLLRLPPVALANGLREHVVEDDFGGETRFLVLPPGDGISYHEALKRSCWKEGTARVWRAERNGSLRHQEQVADCSYDFFDGHVNRPAFRKV